MDVQVLFFNLIACLATREREGAIEDLRNLADWLEKNGFFPKIDENTLKDCIGHLPPHLRCK